MKSLVLLLIVAGIAAGAPHWGGHWDDGQWHGEGVWDHGHWDDGQWHGHWDDGQWHGDWNHGGWWNHGGHWDDGHWHGDGPWDDGQWHGDGHWHHGLPAPVHDTPEVAAAKAAHLAAHAAAAHRWKRSPLFAALVTPVVHHPVLVHTPAVVHTAVVAPAHVAHITHLK